MYAVDGYGRCEDCPHCCALWPDHFNEKVQEVGGLSLDSIRAQPPSLPPLPPVIISWRDGDYGRRWSDALDQGVAATTLEALITRREAKSSIRDQNHLDPSSLLLIDGCNKDLVLEHQWRLRWHEALYQHLRMEEPCVLIAPDLSLYSPRMPRCHHLYQIKRTFVMYQHYQDNGLPAVPFFSFDTEAHVSQASTWLEANPCVTHAAISFQTLHKKQHLWRRHFRYCEMLRDSLTRNLTWLVIGQQDDRRGSLRRRFGDVSFILADPKFALFGRRRRSKELALPFE